MNLAVGFFDAVHLGHRRILALADVAFTFRNHPATVFAPERAPALVMDAASRRLAIADALGRGGEVRMIEFTREFAAMPPEGFVDFLRREYPTLETVFCGGDWTFGAGAAGNADFLRARGIKVETVEQVTVEGKPVSSTRIRAAIAAGDWHTVTACMGRPWRIAGEVMSGKGLGRHLGFPTLNLKTDEELVSPPFGVYALDTQFGRAIANWGLAPTLGGNAWRKPVLEVHLLETTPPTELRTLEVDFLGFIRDERKFASLDELKKQLARDVDAIRKGRFN